jgi:hypothetical protein
MNSFGNFFGSNQSPFGDVYQSQADMYGNSFANPMNPANMNPGFGMDPNLLTPSYTAGYRPQYAGPQPYNQYGRVGFFSGINTILNPMADEYRFGNPIDNHRQTVEGISSRPFDSIVWAGQRIAAPMAGFGLAFKYASRPGAAFGSALGRGIGQGVTAGMGGAMPGLVSRGMTGALAGAGGLAGRLFLPLAVGQAAMYGAQKTIFDPYINTRREARDLRDNFAGITFGDSQGNSVTGQGLSNRESSRIAAGITNQGIRDLTFSTGEYANIADYSGRAGLLDDVNSKQIGKRVKDIAAQIKLVMSIAGDPSIKAAIEELAKLRNAGASVAGGTGSQATQALTQLGYSASVAGRSVQNIMSTVGAQGQYLYQANGMTPYMGQMAAANILGSFETARRNGLLSTAQVARMGGTEGATQASLTAQINGSQTLLNKMAMYNQYVNGHSGASAGGSGMNVNSVTSQFGADFSKDPLGAYGQMQMFSRMLGGQQLKDRGSLGLEDQVYAILNSTAAIRNKDGRYDASKMMPVLTGMMGMSEDDAMAYIAQRTAESDPATYSQGVKARNAQAQKQARQYVSQNYMYGGALGSTVRGIRNTTNNIVGFLAKGGEGLGYDEGRFADMVQGGVDSVMFGSTLTQARGSVNDQIDAATSGKVTDTGPVKINQIDANGGTFNWNRMKRNVSRFGQSIVGNNVDSVFDNRTVLNRINNLAKAGGASAADAQAFINAKTKEEKSQALGRLLKSPDMADMAPQIRGQGGSEAASGNFDDLINDAMDMGTYSQTIDKGTSNGLLDKVNGALGIGDKTVKLGLMDSFNAIGQISDIAGQLNNGDISQADLGDVINSGKYDQVKTLLGGRTGKEARDYIVNAYRKSVGAGLGQAGYVAQNAGLSVESLKKDPNRITDKGDRDKFIAAVKSGDNSTLQNIAAKELARHNGGNLVGTGLNGANNLSLGDVSGFEQQMDELGMQNSKQYDLVKSGRFDFATTQNIINNFDQKKVVDKWDKVADKMDKVAEKMGGDSSSSNGMPSLPSGGWRQVLFGMAPDNQRDAGSPQKK